MRAWVQPEVESSSAADLVRSLNLPRPIAELLVRREVRDPEAAEKFLRPRIEDLPDPWSLRGMEPATERLARAVAQGEPVALYSDYDVDGVTSAALLQEFFEAHGLRVHTYIPHRLREGYGLNRDAIEELCAQGFGLMVTLDCGITAVDEVEHANHLGMDVIVVDHHRCPAELPAARATLNPHQPGCAYPDKVLAAVGVAFHLAVALRQRLRRAGHYGSRPEPNLRRLLDLVALGTIADMVPLQGVNRLLAWHGMAELGRAHRPGIRALLEVCQVRPGRVRGGDVSFKLGPRINAAGRLSDARTGVALLTATDLAVARRHAATLDAANRDRREVEAQVHAEALDRVTDPEAPILVAADPSWHPGVVGIVASKLVERFDRPAVVIGDGGRGSARTARGLHLYDALSACAHHLTKFGGHAAAAGFRIPFDRVEAFAKDLERVVASAQPGGLEEAPLRYDLELGPDALQVGFAKQLRWLEPFGVGNPEPLFRLAPLPLESARLVGKGQHVKLRVLHGARPVSAIAFRQAELAESLRAGEPVELAGHVEINEFAGFERVELRVRDARVPDGDAASALRSVAGV